MTKVRNFVEITPNLPFSEFNFFELYRETFEHSELGRMKKLLPLHEMAESFDSGGNVDAPFIKSFVRKQIDDYSARYIFTFERNDTGESRNIASRIVDSTYGHWSNDSGFIGYGQGILRITQK